MSGAPFVSCDRREDAHFVAHELEPPTAFGHRRDRSGAMSRPSSSWSATGPHSRATNPRVGFRTVIGAQQAAIALAEPIELRVGHHHLPSLS